MGIEIDGETLRVDGTYVDLNALALVGQDTAVQILVETGMSRQRAERFVPLIRRRAVSRALGWLREQLDG